MAISPHASQDRTAKISQFKNHAFTENMRVLCVIIFSFLVSHCEVLKYELNRWPYYISMLKDMVFMLGHVRTIIWWMGRRQLERRYAELAPQNNFQVAEKSSTNPTLTWFLVIPYPWDITVPFSVISRAPHFYPPGVKIQLALANGN